MHQTATASLAAVTIAPASCGAPNAVGALTPAADSTCAGRKTSTSAMNSVAYASARANVVMVASRSGRVQRDQEDHESVTEVCQPRARRRAPSARATARAGRRRSTASFGARARSREVDVGTRSTER
jgi:hypothetical protein